MTLESSIAVHRNGFTLRADLAVPDSQVVVIVGPNGAGKTTLLRALCGLLPLDSGYVRLDGEVLEDTATGVRLPPERRPIAVAFQELRLFPHLSALDNVAFGLRSRGVPLTTARARARELLVDMDIRKQLDARPQAMSGGQAQRVALARALVTRSRLLLLDEPLASVDAAARVELRRALRTHVAAHGGVRVVVTHDPVDALALGDVLMVLDAGRVVEQGPAAEVVARPRSTWLAQMLGGGAVTSLAGASPRRP
jgi:molybdate transport system ATP-binding protein